MKRFLLLVGAPLGALLTGCGGMTVFPGAAAVPPSLTTQALQDATAHHVYWTLFAGSASPQVQFAAVPLRKTSKATSIFNNSHNGLLDSSGMHVDKSGRLWILAFGPSNGDPGIVSVFTLPLKSTSSPKYTFVLSGTSDPDHLTFDASGRLWVNAHANSTIFEYTGPFTKSGTLKAKTTLTKGISSPSGIAFDHRGNLYVANAGSGGTKSIAVFKAPISNKTPFYLNGLNGPGGLIFDKKGNLYASNNGGSPAAIVRYDSNHLAKGDKPSISDPKGLPSGTYEADFALSPTGDLYFANCGSSPGVDVYPTSKKAFSSKLAPSVLYTNSYITGAGCAWGIAIK
jgi:sugar lactone lactonase YvrE